MTRRHLLGTSSLLPLLGPSRAPARATSTPAAYPGVAYRDYFRCLPDFVGDLAAHAYGERNRQIAALTTPAAIRQRQHWARETFWKLIGAPPERTPLNVRTLGSFKREHYTRGEAGLRKPAELSRLG